MTAPTLTLNRKLRVSYHARRRIHQRLKLPKRSAKTVAQKAWDRGRRVGVLGSGARRAAEASCRRHGGAVEHLRIYLDRIWIFVLDANDGAAVLVTVVPCLGAGGGE